MKNITPRTFLSMKLLGLEKSDLERELNDDSGYLSQKQSHLRKELESLRARIDRKDFRKYAASLSDFPSTDHSAPPTSGIPTRRNRTKKDLTSEPRSSVSVETIKNENISEKSSKDSRLAVKKDPFGEQRAFVNHKRKHERDKVREAKERLIKEAHSRREGLRLELQEKMGAKSAKVDAKKKLICVEKQKKADKYNAKLKDAQMRANGRARENSRKEDELYFTIKKRFASATVLKKSLIQSWLSKGRQRRENFEKRIEAKSQISRQIEQDRLSLAASSGQRLELRLGRVRERKEEIHERLRQRLGRAADHAVKVCSNAARARKEAMEASRNELVLKYEKDHLKNKQQKIFMRIEKMRFKRNRMGKLVSYNKMREVRRKIFEKNNRISVIKSMYSRT
jgi:hypothetical protein